MRDYVNEFFAAKPMGVIAGTRYRDRIRKRIHCVDGFHLSVQASEHHYCTPREDDQPHYSAVEVGYPSAREEALMPFVDGDGSEWQTVYGYVPISVVNAIIEAHGGTACDSSTGTPEQHLSTAASDVAQK